MSVLIKDMDIPESCGKCDFNVSSLYCKRTRSEIDRDYEHRERLSDCPISELPDKHGRLIDADADSLRNKLKIINEAEHQIYGRASWGFTAKCIHAFDDAPTVIEAEDSE